MATRKKVRAPEKMTEPEIVMPVVTKSEGKRRYLLIGIALILGIGFWLYKTNNFPIVAVVGMRPVTRFEVNRELYKQSGKSMVDNLVTEILINNELKRSGVVITDTEMNEKIDTIKQSLGEGQDLESLLAQRGMTLDDVKKQLRLQMGVEKLLASKVALTDDEITKFVTENGQYLTATTEAGKKDEAIAALKQQKTQTEVTAWVQDLKNKAKVWYAEPDSTSVVQ